MKKILFRLSLGIVVSLFLFSCSSESDMLSSFSKRKYLKNFKEKKVKYENKIEEVELATTKRFDIDKLNLNEFNNDLALNKKKVEFSIQNRNSIVKKIEKELKDWNKYNRKYDANFLASNHEAIVMHEKFNKVKVNASQVNDVVLIILGIFIPPLAVYLYEDAITGNFWVDLILTLLVWLPGMIFAFLVMFAGVSV